MLTKILPVMVVISLLAGGCGFMNFTTPDPNLIIQQTVSAMQTEAAFVQIQQALLQTQQAINTEIAQMTVISLWTLTPSSTPLPIETPTATATPTLTYTPSVTPSYTPTETVTKKPTATKTPVPPTPEKPCLKIGKVKDVTVADGTKFNAGDDFTKTWRLYNGGSCTWNEEFEIYFTGGNAMSAPASVLLDDRVKPDEYTEVSIDMLAPNKTGTLIGYWRMRSDDGVSFGWGDDADQDFWVEIVVVKPQPTHDPDKVVNFIKELCLADWRSSEGSIECPSVGENFVNGSVQQKSGAKLEGGYVEDETVLITIPSDGSNGSISGKFPAFYVEDGDKFTAIIGCLDKSPDCNVKFQLNYSVGGGSVQNLGSWNQVVDGDFPRVDVDLSSLAGKKVNLILTVLNRGDSKDDRAFWLAPVVER
jgi:hypothetical protein